jgi:MinD-like ATPase involved in chromosome partitioning or flagellar assembly
MYIVTFYSFKGGTGRSMALMNVAAELLSRGKKVLLVDFDLEAPGLDTFPMTIAKSVHKGLVEMISDYLDSSEDFIPSVEDYVYEAKLEGVNDGMLWIMPAGRQDASYDARFKRIDWQDFYEHKDGFLFFEDLKLQWSSSLSPDYVLIDSRTGHTDTGGICTRQLPNAVVAIFVPNEQNIRGLIPVVADVRREVNGPMSKTIDLHFVMGNVPDLDDEDAILSDAIVHSESALEYEKLAATIHHFSSMSMLKQRLLIVDRPRSKIATEYRQLAAAIIFRNFEDRDGALAALDSALANVRFDPDAFSDRPLEDDLQKITALHPKDPEILRRLARLRRAQRKMDEALYLFDQILMSNEDDPESLVGRAEILTGTKPEAALIDLARFFRLSEVSSASFALATRLLVRSNPTHLLEMVNSPAVTMLPSNRVDDIQRELLRSYETSEYAVLFLRKWLAENPDHEDKDGVLHDLVLSLIAAKRFTEAKREAQNDSPDLISSDHFFNYIMAEWGLTAEVPRDLFNSFVGRLSNLAAEETDANMLQCFSLSYWAVGDWDRAFSLLDQAFERSAAAPRIIFSCWSYLYRSPRNFRTDLDAMKAMYLSGSGHPEFIRSPGSTGESVLPFPNI